ncbi:MAG: phosphatase domain-containing protein [bacterium]
MTDWRSELRDLGRDLSSQARRVVRAVDRTVDRDPYHIVGYRAYATHWRALVLGRVMQDEGIVRGDASHSGWQNLLNTVRSLESDPLAHARVRAGIGGETHDIVGDDEGFLREWLKLERPLAEGQWHTVDLELVVANGSAPAKATSQVLVPSPHAAFGVISDIDDTVLQSEVTSFLRAARLVLLENARTRLPFPGVAAFYRALEMGRGGAPHNPIFYVSSSPWNLYHVVSDFLEAQRIPAGPLLLRDWDLATSMAGHGGHKTAIIREILEAYPWMRFILIGDSGQEDPEIYAQVVREYPGRIAAVYIRDVSKSLERTSAITALGTALDATGCSLLLAGDTLSIARHAAAHGWIDDACLTEIGAEAVG